MENTFKETVKEFLSHERGTVISTSSSEKKLLVKAASKWFFHGVNIEFSVEESKDTHSIIDVK